MSYPRPTHLLICSHEYSLLVLEEKDVEKKFQEDALFVRDLFRHYTEYKCTKYMLGLNGPMTITWINLGGGPFKWSTASVATLVTNYKKLIPSFNDCKLWNKVAVAHNNKGAVNWRWYNILNDTRSQEEINDVQTCPICSPEVNANFDQDRNGIIQPKDGEQKLPDHFQKYFGIL